MHQRSTHQELASIPTWETLHTWLRERMQELVQWTLEAEVTELLGRARYQRRAEVDALPGYRNGLEEASQADHTPRDGECTGTYTSEANFRRLSGTAHAMRLPSFRHRSAQWSHAADRLRTANLARKASLR
jgi:hypothetical protein